MRTQEEHMKDLDTLMPIYLSGGVYTYPFITNTEYMRLGVAQKYITLYLPEDVKFVKHLMNRRKKWIAGIVLNDGALTLEDYQSIRFRYDERGKAINLKKENWI